MKEKNQLDKILSTWKMRQFLIALAIVATGLLIGFLFKNKLYLETTNSWIIITASATSILAIFYYLLPNKSDLLTLLNNQLKGAEHSTHLLDKNNNELNLLQRIQKSKVATTIQHSKVKLPLIQKPIFYGIGLTGISLLLLASMTPSSEANQVESKQEVAVTDKKDATKKIESDTLIINKITAAISPPSYTNLKSYSTGNLSLSLPEQSSVRWRFDITGTPDIKEITFDDKQVEKLNANNSYSSKFSNPSFYHYRLTKEGQEDITSDYYPIKIIEDQLPSVEISGVEEYQRLEFADNHDIKFNINCSDDYGLTKMLISATLAKGSGEAVKFREKQIDIKDLRKGSKTYSGSYAFSTSELEMEPGDELYFYVAAKDNCPFEIHWSKSTTHFVILEDTAAVSFVEVGGMQMDLMPDFFRSQRQIIIDTEKLIAEKDTLSKDAFNERSNELGYDQKLLRLKYGQFLGEEAESGLDFDNDVEIDTEGEPIDHSDPNHTHEDEGSKALNDARSLIDQFMHDHDHEEEEGQLLETKGTEKIEEAKNPQWVKDMSHSHDNTEEATFFDVSIKGKLRAALNEMWDAELHLRLFDPEKSLPYQYNSLEFLDEVKNHARAYVQRIGFEPPVIKEQEKRLTGNLKEVYSTRDILKADLDNNLKAIKNALPILLDLQQNLNTIQLEPTEILILQRSGAELSKFALSNSEYLPVLSKLRSLTNKQDAISKEDLEIIIAGFLEIIPLEKREAVAAKYFRHPINVKVINEFKKTR